MEIPEACYGRYRIVRSRLRSLPAALRRGVPFAEAMGADRLIGTARTAGLLVLHGPSPLLGGDEAFQLFLPHFIVRNAVFRNELAPDVVDAVLTDSLKAPWSLLGLLSRPNQGWLATADACRRTADATIVFWNELDQVGARYTTGLPAGQRLWEARGNLPNVLLGIGIPPEIMNEPAPEGGFPEVLARFRPGAS